MAIETLEAQEMLKAMTISAYPHMSDDDRKELHKKVYKTAYPKSNEEKSLTTEDLARMLGNG